MLVVELICNSLYVQSAFAFTSTNYPDIEESIYIAFLRFQHNSQEPSNNDSLCAMEINPRCMHSCQAPLNFSFIPSF